MFDEDLTEIIVTKKDGEVLAVIPKEGGVIQHDDIHLRFNYNDPSYFKDVEGKIYLVE